MTRTMNDLLYAVTLSMIIACLSSCQACSCSKTDPQEAFCHAQFVIRAKVLSHGLVTENNKTRVYNLRIQKVYKGEENLNQTDDIRPYGSHQRSLFAKAYTPVSGARCGVKLDNNTLYLLSGTIRRRKLQLSLCKWFLSWSTITSRQRKGIRGSYAKNCGDM